jgi:manganese efflux pump family protein
MLKAVALIVPLGLDTLAVAAALGVAGLPRDRRLPVSVLLTSFEAAMPLVGLVAGATIGHAISGAAEYLAIAVLLGFGWYMVAGEEHEGEEARLAAMARGGGPAAVALAFSVSLDELAIGFSLGLLDVPLVPVLIAIAVQAFAASQIGLRIGGRVSEAVREGTERLAGLLLAALAVVLLIEKLAG